MIYKISALILILMLCTIIVLAKEKSETKLLTIHYHRYEGDYPNVGIWTWDGTRKKSPKKEEIFETGRNSYGLIFKLDPADYGLDEKNDKIGLLPRLNKDWNRKDGDDRYWTPDMGNNIYLIQGKTQIFTQPPDISQKLLFGFVDGETEITALLSHKMPVKKISPAIFNLSDPDNNPVRIIKTEPIPAGAKKTTKIKLILKEPIDLDGEIFTLSAKNFKASSTGNVIPRNILSSDAYYSPDIELGAVYTKDKTIFRIFTPTARKVFLILYDKPKGDVGRTEIAMIKKEKGIWEIEVPGDLHQKYYLLRIEGQGLNPKEEVLDPYARCVTSHNGRGMIVDLKSTNPKGFDPKKRPPLKNRTDAIIYEAHTHEFTIDPESGAENKGLFLGFTETGTRLKNDKEIKTCLDHLKELGITHVQLLPIQDFDNDESIFHQSNWGYMTVNFNSPDGWFATSQDNTSRITEFKKLVKALHENGIRVIMDVVYNHTAPPASFNKIIPNYYFRMRNDGTYFNGSGTGNEFKSENPMARKFILDSLKYWVEEYGVDGFRFDLMGLIDEKTMTDAAKMLHKIDPSILIYGEPWAAADSGLNKLTQKGVQKGKGFGAFNDHARDAIKGSTSGTDPGFIQNGSRIDNLKKGIEGAINDWAENPDEAIIYAACHDDMTLFDKIAKSSKESVAERKKMQKMAAAIIFTSQGMCFIHSGQEMCRDKGGIHNSYNASEEVNMIKWKWKKENKDVFDYYKGMIDFRKAHPAFRLTCPKEIKKRLSFSKKNPSPKSLSFTIDSKGIEGESCSKIHIIFNADTKEVTFPLAEGEWNIYVKGNKAGLEILETAEKAIKVAPRTSIICTR
jgi:pullulanase